MEIVNFNAKNILIIYIYRYKNCDFNVYFGFIGNF